MNTDHVRSIPIDLLHNRHLRSIPICGDEPVLAPGEIIVGKTVPPAEVSLGPKTSNQGPTTFNWNNDLEDK